MLLIIATLACCNGGTKKGPAQQIENTFIDSLRETQIGTTRFYISLPIDYSIKENEGPDFSVFYFESTDTTIRSTFSGGMYFGNFPSSFGPANDSCKTEIMKGGILGGYPKWTAYDCDEEYSIQTIVDSKSGEGWNSKIHAFGHCTTKDGLNKLLDIYSTLKGK
jgi:hypothetical protein